ncbi:MAG TPA: adenylate/guanylate cyclase domain-containing protein [Candidatus Binatia bacterium]|nr:adenylate/guanylate cyclase domain-containing protein [Candidatus Binatia bacterium]
MERKLTAILAAKVQGYSRLMGADEEGTLRMLTAYREVTDTLIQQYRGRIVGTAGDSVLAEFASAVDAVQCAVDMQRALTGKNADLPAERRMEFRIGINVGDVIVEGPQIYSDGVNIAARLEALADGGGICISGTVYDQVGTKLPLGYESLGEQVVKNIAKPVRVYRVLMDGTAASPVSGQQATSEEVPHRLHIISRRQLMMGAVAGIVVLAAVAAVLTYRSSPSSAPRVEAPAEPASRLPLPDKPSLVVLPFVNMSEDPKQEYFSDGLTEDLTADLSKISSLFVIARNSAFTYKGKAVKVQDVSTELGVRYVLEGSVRKADNQVRITVQLIDATTGGHLWSERYDRPLQDIFALQYEVVRKIVTTLKLQLTLEEHGYSVRKHTDNLEAYDYFLRGVEQGNRTTKEANTQVRQMFERAIELDPQYAHAYAALSAIHWMEWSFGWNQDPQALERGFELAQRAVAMDDSLAQAHAILGVVYLWKKQYDQAIAEAKRAIALDSNLADAYVWLGEILKFAGRPEEAIGLIETAMRLNPHYPASYLFILGTDYRLMGRYEEAIAVLKKALTRNPDLLPAHINLAVVYSELGREEEARAEAAEVLRLNPKYSLEVLRQINPFKDPAVNERLIAALRKAGLK